MRTSTRVAVPLLLSLLASPGAMAKDASTAPPAETPDKTQNTSPIAPKTEHKPFFQQVKENPTKFGDHDLKIESNHKKVSSPTKVHGKTIHHSTTRPAVPPTTSTTTPAVPPTTATKQHVLQDVKENPLKYNDARPEHKGIPGQKERPQDQY